MNTAAMPRSASAEPAAKLSKRKGTRSVSTLTPSQLARKRANDREAQRAIRARTKEHIERLERELDELRSYQSRDKTVQELLRRNKALEDELCRLREAMGGGGGGGGAAGVSMTSSPYSAPVGTATSTSALGGGLDAHQLPHPQHQHQHPQHQQHQHRDHARILSQSLARLTPCPSVYDDNLSVASSGAAMPSPQMSPLPSAADYAPLPEYAQHGQHQSYVGLPSTCEAWAATIPSTAAGGIPSSVPSPASSVADDFAAAGSYIPTSMPSSMMHSAKEVKLELDGITPMGHHHHHHHHHQSGYLHEQSPHAQQQHAHAPQHQSPHQQRGGSPWGAYSMYYDGAAQQACVSR